MIHATIPETRDVHTTIMESYIWAVHTRLNKLYFRPNFRSNPTCWLLAIQLRKPIQSAHNQTVDSATVGRACCPTKQRFQFGRKAATRQRTSTTICQRLFPYSSPKKLFTPLERMTEIITLGWPIVKRLRKRSNNLVQRLFIQHPYCVRFMKPNTQRCGLGLKQAENDTLIFARQCLLTANA